MKVYFVWVYLILFSISCGSDGGADNCDPDAGAEVCDVFSLTNEKRRELGVPVLVWNNELAKTAQKHANEMHDEAYVSHTSLNGDTYFDRVDRSGYKGEATDENISRGQADPKSVIRWWMKESVARQGIMGPNKTLGVGMKGGYWVQAFGKK